MFGKHGAAQIALQSFAPAALVGFLQQRNVTRRRLLDVSDRANAPICCWILRPNVGLKRNVKDEGDGYEVTSTGGGGLNHRLK